MQWSRKIAASLKIQGRSGFPNHRDLASQTLVMGNRTKGLEPVPPSQVVVASMAFGFRKEDVDKSGGAFTSGSGFNRTEPL